MPARAASSLVHRPVCQNIGKRINPSITLQINLAPSDHRLAEVLLPHQIKAWKEQVDEILLVVDSHRSRGRFGEDWETGRNRILTLARNINRARVVEVDYTPAARAAVSRTFFGGRTVPVKDCRGGPYYSYFFALYSAKHDWILHCDADMFFGGASSTWLAEATALHENRPEILFTAPLPGPPSADHTLRQLKAQPLEINGGPAFRFSEMSTRLFLFNRADFACCVGSLRPRPPKLRSRLIALLDGNPAQELPEILFSEAMKERNLCRVDFLGRAPGRWSLHPPYRCADFFAKLPSIVAQIEAGEVPPGQRGDHDINESWVDWSEARARLVHQRWWHRLRARIARSLP